MSFRPQTNQPSLPFDWLTTFPLPLKHPLHTTSIFACFTVGYFLSVFDYFEAAFQEAQWSHLCPYIMGPSAACTDMSPLPSERFLFWLVQPSVCLPIGPLSSQMLAFVCFCLNLFTGPH